MTRGEGTGPRGMVVMTGRAAGFCVGASMPGYANKGQGRGCRRGLRQRNHATGVAGRGRFAGNALPLQMPGQDRDKYYLQNKADALQAELNPLRMRLDEIEP